ncbi:hypothetical protein [Sphingobacterium sp. HMA12]|uniref:hypothetical protein n=1 Tax=Sphingobacterium sp. HMA12 TaxID=2050894 RepID=UPI000CE9CF13|nr:hypothetical protein [Sphingobacterium sp. HMA12]
MKYLLFFVFLLFLGCNPIPKKDKHPDVPQLIDLLKDDSKFRKVTDMTGLSSLVFLSDDRILLRPNNSNSPVKIIDVDKNIVFEKIYNWAQPFYIDKQGNLYFDGKKCFYPDYKKQEDFKTVVIADSLHKKLEELKDLNDSLQTKILTKYEVEILKPYGLKPCPYTIVNTERCDVFKVINQTLVVRQTDLFKSELDLSKTEIPKFDDDVLIGWRNGKLPSPDYLAYYELKKQRFKCNDMTIPKTVTLKGQLYFFAPSLGLYQILF